MNRRHFILSLATILFIVLVFGHKDTVEQSVTPVNQNLPTAANPIPQPTYLKADKLVAQLQTIGVYTDSIKANIVYGSSDTVCHTTGSFGCFANNSITVTPGLSTIQERTTVAHEYMHYIYSTAPDFVARNQQALYNFYLNSQPLYRRLTPYREHNFTPQQLADEVHSFACTEMNDAELPTWLYQHCAMYLPNRSALPTYF